ncbi:uncharacterized protein [Palaemon carinicauda]|uniref:uncharacterized protein n=1 Tax=Palaemon carinicauda TaxID=392227 RepID=UPI0035B65B75
MSPWLLTLHVDGVVREVNARVLGRGLELVDEKDHEWEVNQLSFADDIVVVADAEEKLHQLVTKCEIRKLRVNVGKSKIMICTRREGGARLNVMLNGELSEEVDQFKYLGYIVAANDGVEAVVRQRVNEGFVDDYDDDHNYYPNQGGSCGKLLQSVVCHSQSYGSLP